ncbi:MAG: nitrous oxide reductase family maturation protein NosD, partial [Methanosarcina thermophila]
SNGEGNYTSIQEAINNAQNGDTILVSPGVYRENVNVNKEISIISSTDLSGDMMNRTYVIGAIPAEDVFTIRSNNVTISGFYIAGGPSGMDMDREVGISLEGVQNCLISNNTLILNDIGIGLSNSHFNHLDNNLIGFGASGIYLTQSNENELSNNVATINNHGIHIDNSTNNTLMGNTVESNEIGILLSTSRMNTLENNFVLRNDNGIVLDNTAESNFLTNNSIYMNGIGIYSSGSSGNTIYLNDFFNFFNAEDEGTNTWNSSSAGNTWNDYNGTDADGNGIGDTPYVVNETTGNIDYMPLVENVSSEETLENMNENNIDM